MTHADKRYERTVRLGLYESSDGELREICKNTGYRKYFVNKLFQRFSERVNGLMQIVAGDILSERILMREGYDPIALGI